MPCCRTGTAATHPERSPGCAPRAVPPAESGPAQRPAAAAELARTAFERQAEELRVRLDAYEEDLSRVRATRPGPCWAAEEAYCAAARQKRLGLVQEARRVWQAPAAPENEADRARRMAWLTEEAASLTAAVARRSEAWHGQGPEQPEREPYWLYALVACGWLVTAAFCVWSLLP